MINEVDYDNVVADTEEFIELYNPGTTDFQLMGVAVVLVNGATNASYLTVPLESFGALAPGEYLVIGTQTLIATLPMGTRSVSFAATIDNIQNGAPDGIAITLNGTTLLDSISYEGETIWNFMSMMIPLTEGATSTLSDSNGTQGSLARRPDGYDTNVNSTDFVFVATPTPGTANP